MSRACPHRSRSSPVAFCSASSRGVGLASLIEKESRAPACGSRRVKRPISQVVFPSLVLQSRVLTPLRRLTGSTRTSGLRQAASLNFKVSSVLKSLAKKVIPKEVRMPLGPCRATAEACLFWCSVQHVAVPQLQREHVLHRVHLPSFRWEPALQNHVSKGFWRTFVNRWHRGRGRREWRRLGLNQLNNGLHGFCGHAFKCLDSSWQTLQFDPLSLGQR